MDATPIQIKIEEIERDGPTLPEEIQEKLDRLFLQFHREKEREVLEGSRGSFSGITGKGNPFVSESLIKSVLEDTGRTARSIPPPQDTTPVVASALDTDPTEIPFERGKNGTR